MARFTTRALSTGVALASVMVFVLNVSVLERSRGQPPLSFADTLSASSDAMSSSSDAVNGQISPSMGTVKFGAIADMQYADKEDGWDYSGTKRRRYRRTLSVLKRAIRRWKSAGDVRYVVNLGDMTDSWNVRANHTKSSQAAVMAPILNSGFEWIHQVGNHELYNHCGMDGRGVLPDTAKALPSQVHVTGSPFVFVNLFSYAFSVLCTADNTAAARQFLMDRNKNLAQGDMRPGASAWLDGMEGDSRRFSPLNGGVGTRQVQWLRDVFHHARSHGQYVIMTTHVPFHPSTTSKDNLLWDFKRIMQIVTDDGGGVVVLVLAGHDHAGGFALVRPDTPREVAPGDAPDAEEGIPFVTLPSPLESAEEDCFATATLTAHTDRVEVVVDGEIGEASGRRFVIYR